MKLSDLSKRRLTIAKELYLHGYFHSMKKSLSDAILSILNFDFCSETIIKAILVDSKVNLRRKRGGFKTFDELVSQLQSRFSDLKYLDEVASLHKLRNDVQHQSVIPSEQEVSRHKTTVRLFFDKIAYFVARKGFILWIIDDHKLLGEKYIKTLIRRAQEISKGLKNPFMILYTPASNVAPLLEFLLSVTGAGLKT